MAAADASRRGEEGVSEAAIVRRLIGAEAERRHIWFDDAARGGRASGGYGGHSAA